MAMDKILCWMSHGSDVEINPQYQGLPRGGVDGMLAWMGYHGWELVTTYTNIVSQQEWLFKKPVLEEALE